MNEHYTPAQATLLLAQALLEPKPKTYEALCTELIEAYGYEWFREQQTKAFIIIIAKREGG